MILKPFADEGAVDRAARKSSSGIVLPSKSREQSMSTEPPSRLVRIMQYLFTLLFTKAAILVAVYAAFVLLLAVNSNGGTEQASLTKILAAPYVQFRTVISEQEARDKERVIWASVMAEKRALLDYEDKSKQIELEHQREMTGVLVDRDADLKKTATVNMTCGQVYASNLQNADSVTELDRWTSGAVGAVTNFIGSAFGSERLVSWGDRYQDEVFLEGMVRKDGIKPVTECIKAELEQKNG